MKQIDYTVLDIVDVQTVYLPHFAQIIHCQFINDQLQVWYEYMKSVEVPGPRTFRIYFRREAMDAGLESYIGTFRSEAEQCFVYEVMK